MKMKKHMKNSLSAARSERGIALVMVLVISAIALGIMTGLFFMLTSGTRISGLQKRYKTALEAGLGGAAVSYELIGLRDGSLPSLAGMVVTTSSNCETGTSGYTDCNAIGGMYNGVAAKLNLPTHCWKNCNSSLTINRDEPATYDMFFQLGTAPVYNVYAKIVDTVEGNSGGDEGLVKSGVAASGTGEVQVMARPYLYTIEVEAVRDVPLAERSAVLGVEKAKLSVLYQY